MIGITTTIRAHLSLWLAKHAYAMDSRQWRLAAWLRPFEGIPAPPGFDVLLSEDESISLRLNRYYQLILVWREKSPAFELWSTPMRIQAIYGGELSLGKALDKLTESWPNEESVKRFLNTYLQNEALFLAIVEFWRDIDSQRERWGWTRRIRVKGGHDFVTEIHYDPKKDAAAYHFQLWTLLAKTICEHAPFIDQQQQVLADLYTY